MTSDVNVSRRLSLEPLWTSHRSLGGATKTVFRPTPINVNLSPSPVSPKSLPGPSPIHPASYDGSMRRQDRALVNSLDHRAKHVINNSAPLTPIEEYSPSPLVARLERISILPPMSIAHSLLTPASPDVEPQGDYQLSSERFRSVTTRDGLLAPQDRNPSYYATDSSSLSPVSPRRNSAQDQLRTWGHVYYGNAKTADAFIIARSLRRPSNGSQAETKGLEVRKLAEISKHDAPLGKRVTVRAIVRPRALDKPSFLIQRNFNIEELRATIPDPPSQLPIHSPGGLSPLPVSPRSGVAIPSQTRARRSSSVRSGTLLRAGSSSLDLESLIRDAKAVPIHLRYARAYLPVVAALLQSGHVHEGDVIYLPMPHAEVWPQTAQYVYTGQGELTEAVKENILYLAGKV
ncbi:uncharacterized protein F4822DRAFT_419405 [Hypoxylon trugodes]|uniref:uncharacterized protein n=1 Tax=Hypoxylon trugodes TaxID=326681 RepID=UPI00219A0908|nr:uncharacterized protein F4822DRAFT_419405 [Hypoxylon trugodes]KAI1384324.1 hypothetical protein F4822DRAFT_419405 [Hypoxylon trugodes]